MLNPSTADADRDDPTIRRCIGFAQRFDCGSLAVVNLFALRATDPSELGKADDPVGLMNWPHVVTARKYASDNGLTIAAWGSGSKCPRQLFLNQEKVIKAGLLNDLSRGEEVHCLGTTACGHPRHPLFLPGDQDLELFIRRPALENVEQQGH